MSLEPLEHVSSGINELDYILRGGYRRGRLCLLEGAPGSGKTTLGMQFLLAGVKAGEKAAYITFSETAEELKQSAASHGWNLDQISIIELNKSNVERAPEEEYTVLHSADVELTETSTVLIDEIKRLRPQRIVLDSLSELRMVARDQLRYRRQILALKYAFTEFGGPESDLLLQSIAHSVIVLTSEASTNGGLHRQLQVIKMRGVDFIDGRHDFKITRGGLKIHPRLVPSTETERRAIAPPGALSTGIAELDSLLGGQIPWGFGVMLVGPAGSGKSSLAAQLASSAAEKGRRVCMYSFEESMNTLLRRCEKLGIALPKFVQSGLVRIEKIDPSRTTPGEVTHGISRCIEDNDAGMVVIDSLNGYLQAMRSDQSLIVHLHELLAYLNERSVTTVLVSSQHGIIQPEQTQFDATYLADIVIQLRYFEAQGLVRQAISITKNRGAGHERSIREFDIRDGGIRIGEPLVQFQGVLTGIPEFVGEAGSLIAPKPGEAK
jgi:circadian clock protein KaiC